ncbi:PAS domain-containing hybrid sensor histidine kinase/response regulator [Aliivibrio fischeri]|uniref:PAS domain-containing hybrid sensor histidine kinase/response regulator n=1 Tax=Aliivibrio fischeri TaxID=668 RepID=UPI0007C53BE9|nr:ATP-binding protein [Aliivibrio fischeri]
MKNQLLRYSLIAIITCTLIIIYLMLTRNHPVKQYQRAYLTPSHNIIQSRENIYHFNHQDSKTYDEYASLLVDSELQASFLYNRRTASWLDFFLISDSQVFVSQNTYSYIVVIVTDLESLLKLKVFKEYTIHTIFLLEKQLTNNVQNVEDKYLTSQLTLHRTLAKEIALSDTAINDSDFTSLPNYIKLRKRIESKPKEQSIDSTVKQTLTKQNAYWITQSEAIKTQLFITTLFLLCCIALYFYIRLSDKLIKTLTIKRELIRSEKEKAKLALVAEYAHDAIFILDKQGRLNWINQSYSALSGNTLEDIKGKDLPSILQLDKIKHANIIILLQSLETGTSISFELTNHHKDGTLFWIDVSITPILEPNGNIMHYIAVERDITKKKELEDKLIKAANKADVSNRAKSTFLATMSHELRTPLNGILGMAQIIESNIKDKEQHKQIKMLLESGDHLLFLLNEILDFSKIEQNKLELNHASFYFVDIIEPITNTYLSVCENKGLQFIIDNKINNETVFIGDKPRIRQIIFNLISNAVKFTHEGSITLNFSHTLTGKGEQAVQIKIKDTGVGIRENRLKHIFEPYIQAEASTTRQYGGTGLGLAIVKQLTDIMRGYISVSSSEGKGSCFTLVLPLDITKSKQLKDNDALLPSEQSKSTNPIPMANLSILIAEDNKINALVAQMFCQRLGHKAIIAENGKVAIDKLKETHFDLIIMDNHMPVMDGILATKIIREKLKISTVIFAYTANVFQKAHDNFLKAGANYVLTKPLQENDFIGAIKQYQDAIIQQKKNAILRSKKNRNIIELRRPFKYPCSDNTLIKAEIKLTSIQDICGTDSKFICVFLQSFIDISEENITEIITAFEKKDTESIRFNAHSIKGMASNFRASRLIKIATSIELCAKKKNMPKLEDVQQLINLLEINIQQASRLLEKYKIQ